MKSFEGKVAIVTGAGGTGIGNALAQELAARGASVACCDIAGLEQTEEQLAARGADFLTETVDVSDRQAMGRFVASVVARFGHIDLLINNAGIALGDRTFADLTLEDFDRITGVNYWGVVNTTQHCYQHLLARPEAAIVNISSAQGILGLPYLVPYCTTKFAVRGFTDSLRAEHRIRGIRNVTVHTVHPGAVATDITLHADYQDSASQKFHERLQRGTSAAQAARIILDGVKRNTGRIFISDGRFHDVLTRLLPTANTHIVRAVMRMRRIAVH